MSPIDYITKYCIISKRRKNLYKITFTKIDKDRDGKISLKVGVTMGMSIQDRNLMETGKS